jgi:hypothetical protein
MRICSFSSLGCILLLSSLLSLTLSLVSAGDFISWTPEAMHTIAWAMSDRGIPRSYRMMQGFGVHTFSLINKEGVCTFVKFHWKPTLGVHGLVWDESARLGGVDGDFHRRDLFDAIASGNFPEWELGFQTVSEADENKFDFDSKSNKRRTGAEQTLVESAMIVNMHLILHPMYASFCPAPRLSQSSTQRRSSPRSSPLSAGLVR